MEAFTLDTSGAVEGPHRDESGPEWVKRWSDLPLFAQGTLAKATEEISADPAFMDTWFHKHGHRAPGFADWSPEALALILRDCALVWSDFMAGVERSEGWQRQLGREFWYQRQQGLHTRFPPLRVFLSDEGRVCVEEVR